MAKNLSFTKNFYKLLIAPAVVLVVGIVMLCVKGANLDINFTGGYLSSYSYSGEINENTVKDVISGVVDYNISVSKSSDMTGDASRIVVSIAAKDGISAEEQTAVTNALVEAFPDNSIALYDINNVSATVGSKFFVKSLFAVGLAAIFVVIYVALRFRNIGGAGAAVSSLIALLHDVVIAFLFCVIFQIKIDTNFMAVVLTLLGYSLNNTIVIYDRVRENRSKYPKLEREEIVNNSINETLTRSILTTVTTLLAVIAVAVISEIKGVTSLRSFALPMAVGLISGCFSSLCIAGPLWVKWRAFTDKKFPKKK